MFKSMILIASFWLASSGSAEELEKASLQKHLSLVGFIRVGAGDKQSLVVLKTKDGSKTMILRTEDAIPGTKYRILRMLRDELVVEGPQGEETIPLETAADTTYPLAISETYRSEPETDPRSETAQANYNELRRRSTPPSVDLKDTSRDGGNGELQAGQIIASPPEVHEIQLRRAPVSLEPKTSTSEMPCLESDCAVTLSPEE